MGLVRPVMAVLALLASIAPNDVAFAQDAPVVEPDTLARLLNADALVCSFAVGAVGDWRAQAPVVNPAGPGQQTMVFDQIEAQNYRARLASGFGEPTEILLLRTQIGLTFVEENTLGGIHVTTVYGASPTGEPAFLAVHSRHFLDGGAPAPAQYHGLCGAAP